MRMHSMNGSLGDAVHPPIPSDEQAIELIRKAGQGSRTRYWEGLAVSAVSKVTGVKPVDINHVRAQLSENPYGIPRGVYLVPRALCVVRRALCLVPRNSCLMPRALYLQVRVQFIKSRLLDIELGRLPDPTYLDSTGTRRRLPEVVIHTYSCVHGCMHR